MTDPALTAAPFDAAWYLARYADVRAAGLDPWAHYIADGHKEGRLAAPVRALELDFILWRGFEAQALPELRALLRHGPARERAVAGWVLARHAAFRRRWRSALAAIRVFLDSDEGPVIVPHAGPYLLAVQAAAACGATGYARDALARAEARFDQTADLALAGLEIARNDNAGDSAVAASLARIHAGSRLVPLSLRDGQGPFIDRLTTRCAPAPVTEGPLVSVIVPAYRAETTLPTCLRGLTAQSWRNLEIIVVDDASPDGTAEVAERAAAADPRIKLIRQPVNGGAYVARNAGVAAARGAFLTVQDADDWAHPQKIEEQVRPLLQDNAPVASASHWVRVGEDLSMTLWRIDRGWVFRNVSSLMIRSAIREAIGYWDRVRISADTEYYHRLIAVYGAESIVEVHAGRPLTFGRNASDSLTQTSATHISTQFRGPRRAYIDAAAHWHDRQMETLGEGADIAARAAALFLPQHPASRPFPAPPEARPADSTVCPSDYAAVAASPHFDPLWYLARNADARAADADPVRHYVETGAAQDRDPGPTFSASAWRRLRGLEAGSLSLVDRDALPADIAPPPPRFDGGLSAGGLPRALVFAHAAGRYPLWAERAFLDLLDRLAAGREGPAMAPVAVLPSAVNGDYLEAVRARAVSVEILPQLWRHRFRTPPAETIAAIRQMIRRTRPRELHVNTLFLDAPFEAARAEGCPSVLHLHERPADDPALCRQLGDSAHGLRRRLLAQADRITVTSAAAAHWLNCADRVSLTPDRIDPALFGLPFDPGPALRVALIGRNTAQGGIGEVLQLSRLVADAEREAGVRPAERCRFLLIGPETADLLHLGALPGNLSYAGHADGPLAAMAQADLVLNLVRGGDPTGRTTREALAAGRPVICYDRGASRDMIVPGECGFAVPEGNLEALARAVLALSVARLGLLDMSRAARKRARKLEQDAPSTDAS